MVICINVGRGVAAGPGLRHCARLLAWPPYIGRGAGHKPNHGERDSAQAEASSKDVRQERRPRAETRLGPRLATERMAG